MFKKSLHYSVSSSYYVTDAKIYQLKTKDSEIKDYEQCLGNISKDFTINNMKKTGLKEIVNCFSADFNLIDTNNILNIHKCLMKKT